MYAKGIKLQSYVLGKKVWFNSKYVKIKRNQKSKSKFFGFFQVLHLIDKQTYQLELLAK